MITLTCALAVFLCVWLIAIFTGMARTLRRTYIQCAFQSNLGYIGLAVVFYYLGEPGLAKDGIFAGFIMILQNILAVISASLFKIAAMPGLGSPFSNCSTSRPQISTRSNTPVFRGLDMSAQRRVWAKRLFCDRF